VEKEIKNKKQFLVQMYKRERIIWQVKKLSNFEHAFFFSASEIL
jgi:hypothetical protein